jgi:hypothetical protein
MTLNELIKDINMHLPGNRFDDETITMWINEIEGKIFEEIASRTLSKQGNRVTFVRRDRNGEWLTDVRTINKLHDSTKDADKDGVPDRESPLTALDADNGSLAAFGSLVNGSTATTSADNTAGSQAAANSPAAAPERNYREEIDPLDLSSHCECFMDCASQVRYELIPYSHPQDDNTQLICPDRFADVYVHYVLAKMHAADSEINEYNNEVLLFNASYEDYAAWHIRNFRR